MPDDGQGPAPGTSGGPPPPIPPPGSAPNVPPPGAPPGAPPHLQPPVGSHPPVSGRGLGPGAEIPLDGRQLPIRPMSVGDVLDGSFGGLRATFVPVAILVAIVLGPAQLLLNLIVSRLAPGSAGTGILAAFGDFDQAAAGGDPAVVGVTLLFTLVSTVLTLAVTAAVIALLLQVDRGEQTDARVAMRRAWSVLGSVLVASLLLGIGSSVGAIAFVLVGVLVGFAIPIVGPILAIVLFLPTFVIGGAALLGTYSLVVPIAVVEGGNPIEVIGRALWVLRRRFWRLVGITLLVAILATIATFGLQLPFALLAFVAGPFAWVADSVGQVLAQIVVVPVTGFAALLVYLDARVRHEGLDLQLRSRGIRSA